MESGNLDVLDELMAANFDDHDDPNPSDTLEGLEHAMTTGISITRLASGKFVERWTMFDALGLLQQLGVIPPSV